MIHVIELTGDTLDNIFLQFDPNAYQAGVQADMRLQNRDSNDPEQAPAPEEGDRIMLLATFIGIVLGGIAGFCIGMYGIGRSAVFLSIIIGMLIGGFIGVYTGSYLKKKKLGNGGSSGGLSAA